MPTYRYYTIDPRAGTPVVELPLYGVTMDKVFNAPGNIMGTFRLGTHKLDDLSLINGTIPGRHGIVCKRNDVPIWAGMIWSRTYASDAKTVQLTGQTFESIFNHIAMRFHFFGTTEEVTHYQNLINYMQTEVDTAYNFNFTVAHPGLTGNQRTMDYLASEWRLVQEPLDQLSEYHDGLGYTVNIGAGANDTITKTFQLVKKPYGAAPDSGLHLDYPGTVSSYWYSENSSNGCVTMVGRAGNLAPGASMPVATTTYQNRVDEGFVPWHKVNMFSDVQSDLDLVDRTTREMWKNMMPMQSPTFELGAHSNFINWNDLGKWFSVRIYPNDARFPSEMGEFGYKYLEHALEAWSLTPESRDQPEIIRIQMRGDEV